MAKYTSLRTLHSSGMMFSLRVKLNSESEHVSSTSNKREHYTVEVDLQVAIHDCLHVGIQL